MGLDPASWALIAATVGGSAMGGVTAPEGQKMSSFEGDSALDPFEVGGDVRSKLDQLFELAMGQAAEPVDIKTTVNPLPSFAGGGLPMPIGAMGMDAGRISPQMLPNKPALAIPEGKDYNGERDEQRGDLPFGLSWVDVERSPQLQDEFLSGGKFLPPAIRRRVSKPQSGGGDDFDGAMAALQLLGVQ